MVMELIHKDKDTEFFLMLLTYNDKMRELERRPPNRLLIRLITSHIIM